MLIPRVDLLLLLALGCWPGNAARNGYGPAPTASPPALWLSLLLPLLLALTVGYLQSFDDLRQRRAAPAGTAVTAGRFP